MSEEKRDNLGKTLLKLVSEVEGESETNSRGLSDDLVEEKTGIETSYDFEKQKSTSESPLLDHHKPSQSEMRNFSLEFIKDSAPPSAKSSSFFDIIHLLVIVLCDLNAGPIDFQDVIGVKRTPKFEEFVLYLKMMEIYGAGYQDDVDMFNYNIRNEKTHTQQMIE